MLHFLPQGITFLHTKDIFMIVEADPVAGKQRLNRVRAQLQLTQQQLADRAKVDRRVVIRAENGQTISLMSAYAILNILNALRQDTGQTTLDIEDVVWNVED